jgi:outer membrane protein
MRFRIPALLILVAALPSFSASAQRVITFDEAVQIALQQSVTLRRAENTVRTQRATLSQEKSSLLPSLNASSSTSRNWGLTFDQTTLQLVTQSSDRFSMSANASLNLFNGFADVAGIEQAKLNLAAEEESFTRTQQSVVFNVISSYLQVILNREQIGIRQEDLTSQQGQLSSIEEFVRVGARPVSDLYQQQAVVAASEATLLNAERDLQLSETRLIQVLQLDPLGAYTFEAPSSDEIPLLPRQYAADDLLRSAFERRRDLRAQELAIDASAQSIRISRAGYLPRLNLTGGVSTGYSSLSVDPFTRESKSFGSQLEDNRSESVGLSLNIPIFDRFVTKNSVERARVQYDNARLDLENLRQTIALEVRQAYLDYETAVKRLDVTDKQVRASAQALEVEEERYAVGASTLVELTQARARYVDSASQRVQAIFQFHFQHKVIEYYQGIIDPSETLF